MGLGFRVLFVFLLSDWVRLEVGLEAGREARPYPIPPLHLIDSCVGLHKQCLVLRIILSLHTQIFSFHLFVSFLKGPMLDAGQSFVTHKVYRTVLSCVIVSCRFLLHVCGFCPHQEGNLSEIFAFFVAFVEKDILPRVGCAQSFFYKKLITW